MSVCLAGRGWMDGGREREPSSVGVQLTNSDSIHYQFIYSLLELLRDIHINDTSTIYYDGAVKSDLPLYHGQSQDKIK